MWRFGRSFSSSYSVIRQYSSHVRGISNCAKVAVNRRESTSDHGRDQLETPEPQLYQRMLEQTIDSGYLRMLGSASPQDLDDIMGVGQVRATRIEAAVRMIADVFAVYDDRDTDLLEHELSNEFGESDEKEFDDDEISENESGSKEVDQSEERLMEYLANVKPVEKKLGEVFFPNTNRSKSPQAYDYIELQAGSDALADGPGSWAMAWKTLLSYLEKYSPKSVEELQKTINIENGSPDIRAIELFMKELISVQQTKPALLALECLILSEMDLSRQIWLVGIKAAIEGGHFDDFKRLAKLIDLTRTAHNASLSSKAGTLTPISSQSPMAWYYRNASDKKLSSRFFGNSPLSSSKELTVLNHLLPGLARFRQFAHVDTVLRYMIANQYSLSAKVLACNFRCSTISRDSVRFQWTWNQVEQLDPTQIDSSLLETAMSAAKAIDNSHLLKIIDQFAQNHNIKI